MRITTTEALFTLLNPFQWAVQPDLHAFPLEHSSEAEADWEEWSQLAV